MKKLIVASMIGNGLEWYDYAIYAQLLNIISVKFFPAGNEFGKIFSFAIFALGAFARPLGGIVFGQIGDKVGRKPALMIGILAMSVPTAGIGLLPEYSSIGIWAPIILTILRLFQGLALGGEFSGCISYVVECSPKKSRGLYGSTSFISMTLGMLLGVTVASITSKFMPEEDFLSWGWRVPFIGGLFVGIIGLYMRRYLSESPVYKNAKNEGFLSRAPLKESLKSWKKLVLGIMITINVCVPFNAMTIFMKSYLADIGYNSHDASTVSYVILITMSITFPISALISDHIGRKPVLIVSSFMLLIVVYPAFYMLNTLELKLAIISQIFFAFAAGMYMGTTPTTLVEVFPTKIRFTSVAISYNLSVAAFGSTIPVIGTSFTKILQKPMYIAYYIIFLTIICLIIVQKFYKETFALNLNNKTTSTNQTNTYNEEPIIN